MIFVFFIALNLTCLNLNAATIASLNPIQEAILNDSIVNAIKLIPQKPTGATLFWSAMAYDLSGDFEKAYELYDRYLTSETEYKKSAQERRDYLHDLLFSNGQINTKSYSTSLSDQANLVYEQKIKSLKKSTLSQLSERGLPIDLYYIDLIENKRDNLNRLPSYLKARLLLQTSKGPEDIKAAFEAFKAPFTFEPYIIAFPNDAKKQLSENPALNIAYFNGLVLLANQEPLLAVDPLIEATRGDYKVQALFALMKAYDQLGRFKDKELVRSEFLSLPENPLTAEVEFEKFSYEDYLFGDKEALKHLKRFVEKYPSSPLILNAYYLLGLDLKKARKKVHPKNLNEAIDHFQKVETLFSKLDIKSDRLGYYKNLVREATLERAKTLILIAEEGSDSKKKIYLEYAIDLVDQILKEPSGEAVLLYAKLLKMKGDNSIAYLESNLSKLDPYSLDLAKLELAKHYENQNPKKALDIIENLNALSPSEKLEAKLIKSHIHEKEGDLDKALLTLSEIINENCVSERRIEAMYQRALIYEKQNRFDLALRQLDACRLKGGKWGEAAMKKWESLHGTDR